MIVALLAQARSVTEVPAAAEHSFAYWKLMVPVLLVACAIAWVVRAGKDRDRARQCKILCGVYVVVLAAVLLWPPMEYVVQSEDRWNVITQQYERQIPRYIDLGPTWIGKLGTTYSTSSGSIYGPEIASTHRILPAKWVVRIIIPTLAFAGVFGWVLTRASPQQQRP